MGIRKKSASLISLHFDLSEKIRVGKDYQAVCPEMIPVHDRRLEALNERSLLVWSPTKDIPESKCKYKFQIILSGSLRLSGSSVFARIN